MPLVCFLTQSVLRDPDDDNPSHPSSPGQVELGDKIIAELKEIGITEIDRLEDKSFLFTLPATTGMEEAPHVCLAAHLDTYYGTSGQVSPMIHKYTDGDIALPNDGVVIPASDLVGLGGAHVISADGTSLLGGDDKGGVATLVTTIEDIVKNGTPHGPLTFWFCNDEEIGELGFSYLDEDRVNSWDVFLTVDGGRLGPIDVGCFYCRIFNMTFHGEDTHPGEYPKDLHPSHYAAMEFIMELKARFNLPEAGILEPMSSFFYITKIEGGAGKTVVHMAPRSFDLEESEEMVTTAEELAANCARNYDCTVETTDNKLATINNFDSIDPQRHLLVPLLEAHEAAGFTPSENMVRGGTDGSMLNVEYPELCTPNMGYGSCNIHGVKEFVVLEELEQTPDIVLEAIALWAKMTTTVPS